MLYVRPGRMGHETDVRIIWDLGIMCIQVNIYIQTYS